MTITWVFYSFIAPAIVISIILTAIDNRGIISIPNVSLFVLSIVRNSLLKEISRNKIVPKHLALIMDGNRRFAHQNSISTETGYISGAESLMKVLEMCCKFGISTVTVFAFSNDNFSREATELNSIFGLLEKKINNMALPENLVQRLGVRIKPIGNLSRFPKKIEDALNKAAEATKDNRKHTLNICCAYTSRDEILGAVRTASAKMDHSTHIKCDSNFIVKSLNVSDDVDMLIRTSGEYRLSDFLTWQVSSECLIHFCDKYWPEFNYLDFLIAMLKYQKYATTRLNYHTIG